jgi:hypothetical protein
MSSPATSPETRGLTSAFFFLLLWPGFRSLEKPTGDHRLNLANAPERDISKRIIRNEGYHLFVPHILHLQHTKP